MTRRKWVQIEGQLVEVDPSSYVPVDRSSSTRYVSDAWMDGTRSPIDGADIGSRTKLREHMKIHSVIDHSEAVQEAALQRRRAAAAAEVARKNDLIEALHRVRAGYKPRIEEYRDE